MPLIPALGRQKQVDFCELETSLVYKSKFQDRLQSCRITISQKTKNKQTNKNKNKTKQKNRSL